MKNNNDDQSIGKVIAYYKHRGFGFLKGDDGLKRIFYLSAVKNRIVLKASDGVKFTAISNQKGQAKATRISIIEYTTNGNSISNNILFKKIRKNWRIEAKNEDIQKLFYHLDELEQITDEDKCFVIGRKGTGKTALAEYLSTLNSTDCFTERLSFKNFPFNQLYEMQDSKFPFNNQYITIWKYLIYGSVLKMMSLNETIDSSLLGTLRKLFPLDPIDSLTKKFDNLIGIELKFDALGLKLNPSKQSSDEKTTFIQKVEVFENILINYTDASNYFVIIDALDDDYNNMNKDKISIYFSMLSSLFKAVQDIKSVLPYPKFKIQPVVFLRDDIYKQIKDSDKTKWEDYSVQLIWDENKIKKMLAYRISKTINGESNTDSFDTAWRKLFPFNHVTESWGNEAPFDLIAEATYMRPRDFIQFIKACCDKALNEGQVQIDSRIFKESLSSFSNWMRSELQNEMRGVIPEIEIVMNIISHNRKVEFQSKDFISKYKEKAANGELLEAQSPEFVLQTLFKFFAIGNKTKSSHEVYYNNNNHSELNLNETIIVHKGLRKSLQIA